MVCEINPEAVINTCGGVGVACECRYGISQNAALTTPCCQTRTAIEQSQDDVD